MKFPAMPVRTGQDATFNFEVLRQVLVHPKAPAEVTRALETTYQPSTIATTLVIVTFSLRAKAGEVNAVAEVLMDANSPPTTLIAQPQVENENAAVVKTQSSVTFLVPPGFYYKLKKNVGTVAVQTTFEYGLG